MWTLLLLAATVRSFVHMPLGISDRNKMVMWPGLGRRDMRLHTSEEATACSSFNCAARCILFTAPRACILFFCCFMASCQFANCAICSLVAGFVFTLMVYGYRIIVLRCRWLITPVIRGKISSLISQLRAGATGVAEILFEQPFRLLRDYRGFPHHGSRNNFLRITAAFKSTCLAIDMTQHYVPNHNHFTSKIQGFMFRGLGF